MVNAQSDRIAELEGTLMGGVARVESACDELQRVRARLIRIGEDVRDQTAGILADTTMLIDEVMDGVQSPTQEEDPEEKIPPDDPTVD